MLTARALVWLKGHFMGEDAFGNSYYQERFLFSKPNRRPRRWVVYGGTPDASTVPAEWHAWLHFTHEAPLIDKPKRPWQRAHRPNPTGTQNAYRPPASPLNRDKKPVKKPYTSWTPK